MLKENEILVQANPVKYHNIDYKDDFIVVTQNRTRRRIKNGYYFDDTGTHIYISTYYSSLFQYKNKIRRFILNKKTKEWRDYQSIIIEKYEPEKIKPKESNNIKRLKK